MPVWSQNRIVRTLERPLVPPRVLLVCLSLGSTDPALIHLMPKVSWPCEPLRVDEPWLTMEAFIWNNSWHEAAWKGTWAGRPWLCVVEKKGRKAALGNVD